MESTRMDGVVAENVEERREGKGEKREREKERRRKRIVDGKLVQSRDAAVVIGQLLDYELL